MSLSAVKGPGLGVQVASDPWGLGIGRGQHHFDDPSGPLWQSSIFVSRMSLNDIFVSDELDFCVKIGGLNQFREFFFRKRCQFPWKCMGLRVRQTIGRVSGRFPKPWGFNAKIVSVRIIRGSPTFRLHMHKLNGTNIT